VKIHGARLEVRRLSKTFGGGRVVDDVSFAVEGGRFLTLLGPSGSGKTTTLRMIAGFEEPTDGEILVADTAITDRPPYRRGVDEQSRLSHGGAVVPAAGKGRHRRTKQADRTIQGRIEKRGAFKIGLVIENSLNAKLETMTAIHYGTTINVCHRPSCGISESNLSVFKRGVTSTPSASGVNVSSGFFFAFMMFGNVT